MQFQEVVLGAGVALAATCLGAGAVVALRKIGCREQALALAIAFGIGA